MSGFMGPDGKWLSEPHRDDDAIIVADLDLGVLALPRFFADSGGHYARPELLSLMIDPRRTAPMQSQVDAMEARGAEPESQPLEQP